MHSRAVRPVAAILGLTALLGGCGIGHGDASEREAFACSRGFRPADWREEKLKTAQSVARCGWLEGWSKQRLRAALGPPDGGRALAPTWDAGTSRAGIGPMGWFLVVRLDRHRRVARATTILRGT